jgi:ABC-2 type transport system permease protein
MSAPAIPATPFQRARWTLTDGLTLSGRVMIQFRHNPSVVLIALVVPAVMVLLFGYVLGSAIPVPGGGNYRAYLMPGLFVMVTFMGIGTTATEVAADAARGITDRLRSMPVSSFAVPFGQAGADFITTGIGIGLMAVTGAIVGWGAHEGIGRTALGFGLLLLLRYAGSWVGAYLGLRVKDEAMANQLVPILMPMTLISTAIVPTAGMPGWLRTIAEWNPVSSVVTACRELFGNPVGLREDVPWPLEHPVAASILWSTALLVVFVPLAVRRHRLRGR